MFVLDEDEYREFKRYKASLSAPTTSQSTAVCDICHREFPNDNILAHHRKSHVDGFKCNICNKVFQQKQHLTAHLVKHTPQLEPSKHSVLDSKMPNQPPSRLPDPPQPVAPTAPAPLPPQTKPRKHKSLVNFQLKHWLTLK